MTGINRPNITINGVKYKLTPSIPAIYSERSRKQGKYIMEKNQKCMVSIESPHHGGREGYFQFHAEPNDTIVLSTTPLNDEDDDSGVFFAIDAQYVVGVNIQ